MYRPTFIAFNQTEWAEITANCVGEYIYNHGMCGNEPNTCADKGETKFLYTWV